MNDLNVSLRMDFDYSGSNEAKRAERDLKDIRKATKGLEKIGLNKLDKDLGEVSAEARAAGKALEVPAQKLKQLNRLSTDRAEAELKQLGKSARVAGKDIDKLNRTKLNRLNGTVDASSQKLDRLRNRLNNSTAIHEPAGRLSGSMNVLATSAGSAFGALLAFASIDNIVRGLNQMEDGFNKVDAAATRVAITAEMRDPEIIAGIRASNDTLALKYGQKVEQVNDARNVYAAANYGIARQEAILDPTVKTAFAAGAAPETIARAVLAAINNLGLKEQEVPAFLDQIVKGGKEGEFEIEAMAKTFPELGALYSASGRSGPDATAELIALAQIVRKGTGMEGTAATNLQNLLSKMAAPDTVKNFKEAGVSLPKIAQRSQAQGTPYIIELLDEVERLTGGDEFKIGELFGDMQAKSALRPLLANRDEYTKILKAVREDSKGLVDKDADFLAETPQAAADRRAAALAKTGRGAGAIWGSTVNPFVDEFLGLINPEYRRLEAGRKENKQLRGTDLGVLESDIKELEDAISARPQSPFGLPDMERQKLEMQLRELKFERESARKAQGVEPAQSEAPKAGRIDLEGVDLKPELDEVSSVFGPAGTKAGSDFANAVEREATRVVAMAQQLETALSFTATPTISPNFSAASPTAATGNPASAGAGQTVVNQNFRGQSDARATARVVMREQNRAISGSRSRALHDTGSLA